MASSSNSNVDGRGNGSASLQDVEWLSSLSESELDFLISLKEMAIRRAKNIGHKNLGEKFDLRILRALGVIMFEYFKDRAQTTSLFSDFTETSKLLNGCGLAAPNQEGNRGSVPSSEGINTFSFVTPRRKRMWDGLCEEPASFSKSRKQQRQAHEFTFDDS